MRLCFLALWNNTADMSRLLSQLVLARQTSADRLEAKHVKISAGGHHRPKHIAVIIRSLSDSTKVIQHDS